MRGLPVLLSLPGLCASCFPSNVVAPEARRVVLGVEDLAWRPATDGDVPGSYSSEDITGSLAAVLLEVHYLFRPDGTYTGAALIGAEHPSFRVLSGTWVLDSYSLQLDDAAPGVLDVAENRLRLSGEEGAVVLRRNARP